MLTGGGGWVSALGVGIWGLSTYVDLEKDPAPLPKDPSLKELPYP